jgi:hypothetical protein
VPLALVLVVLVALLLLLPLRLALHRLVLPPVLRLACLAAVKHSAAVSAKATAP